MVCMWNCWWRQFRTCYFTVLSIEIFIMPISCLFYFGRFDNTCMLLLFPDYKLFKTQIAAKCQATNYGICLPREILKTLSNLQNSSIKTYTLIKISNPVKFPFKTMLKVFLTLLNVMMMLIIIPWRKPMRSPASRWPWG